MKKKKVNYPSIFKEVKTMPFDYDEGGAPVTFTEMIFNHDPIGLWHPQDEKQLGKYFARIMSLPETVN